ncbi:hypothetical protein DPMN_037957, partial [Dreissena polymorpha]
MGVATALTTDEEAALRRNTQCECPTRTSTDQEVQMECSFSSIESSQIDDTHFDVSFTVGDDRILPLQQASVSKQSLSDTQPIENSATDCLPELALAAMECALTPRKKRKFEQCYNCSIDLQDTVFQTWRHLKGQVETQAASNPEEQHDVLAVATTAVKTQRKPTEPTCTVVDHPLVRAGLIPEDLVNVLVVPTPTKRSVNKRGIGKARVLTSREVQEELEEKEKQKQHLSEQKEKRKREREERRLQNEIEKRHKKQQREKLKAEKLKEKKKGKTNEDTTKQTCRPNEYRTIKHTSGRFRTNSADDNDDDVDDDDDED